MPRLPAAFCMALALTGAQGAAQAQQSDTVWNCKDKQGRTHVTNLKADTVGKDCRVIRRQRITVVPSAELTRPPATAAARPAREDRSARSAARERQRQILEKELAAEESLLARAKADLAAQESTRQGDERNYARTLERLKPYQDNVETHEKNVATLRRELSNLDR